MKKLTLLLCVLALAALGVAACGDDDDDEEAATEATTETTEAGDGGGGGTVSLTADANGDLAYEEDTLTAPAGEVTIEFDNPASVGHDVVVEDEGGNELARTEVISDDSATTTGEFESGDYTYYCSVPGHRDAGMEGTLTVE